MRRVILLFVGILALSSVPLVWAGEGNGEDDPDAEASRLYARENLIAEATRVVGTMRPTPERLESLRKAIGEDVLFLTRFEPKDAEEAKLAEEFDLTIQERLLLVGRAETNDDPGSPGAILEAVRLSKWLEGEEPCDVVIADATTRPGDERTYPYPPPPPTPPSVAESPEVADDAPAEEAGLGPAPAGPPPPPVDTGDGAEPGTKPEAEGGNGGNGAKSDTEKAATPAAPEVVPAPPEQPLEPWEPPSTSDWAKQTVLVAEKGTLKDKRIGPAVCTTIDALLAVSKATPLFHHPEVGVLQRHAIVAEDVFAYNLPSIAVRQLQEAENVTALQADIPAGLVDESTVGMKAERAQKMRKRVEALDAKSAALERTMDRMAIDIDAWKTQAALLSREIEDERGRIEAAAEAAAPAETEGEGEEANEGENRSEEAAALPKTLRLQLAQARESLVGLDLRLFYMTVLRTERRLELVDMLRRSADAEATAAESVFTRFEEELVRVRNERRLGRLRGSERSLKRWIEIEEERAPAEGSAGALRITAYGAVLAANTVAQDAVLRRRALTGRATVREAAESRQSAEDQAGKAGKGGTAEKVASSPSDSKATGAGDPAEGKRLSALMRAPHTRTWDAKYVEAAQNELEDPELAEEFDAALVAEHYAAVDERIAALEESLEVAPDVPRMRAAFADVETEAVAALKPLEREYLTMTVRRLPKILSSTREDFDSAMSGIEEQIERNLKRLVRLNEYHGALKRQGTRSLLIRTQRDLDHRDFVSAFDESNSGFTRVVRWVTFQGERHLGTYLGRSWPRVLGLLVGLLLIAFGVRAGRRRVDHWVQEKAATETALIGTAVSVREEQEEVKRRREEVAEARAAAPEDVLEVVRADLEEPESADSPDEDDDEGEEARKEDEKPGQAVVKDEIIRSAPAAPGAGASPKPKEAS